MKAYRFLLVTAVAACAPSVETASVTPGAGQATAMAAAVESIQPRDFYARIGFLASDALEGRDTPSPGLEAAAAYISSEFHRIGLEPAGDNGTWLQRWPYTTRSVDFAGVRFDLNGQPLAFRSDYFVQPSTRAAFTGGITLVGTSIQPDDIRRRALAGRAAMVAPTAALNNQALGRLRAAADSAGAGALIIVLPENVDAAAIAAEAARGRAPGVIPVFFLRRDRAREIVRATENRSFDELARDDSPVRMVNLSGANASFAAPMTEVVHRPPNVVGILRGSDPVLRNEYVVFSAHIDHTGICAPTAADRICNGADDDASGTSAIMELAEAYAMLPVKPRRSMVFLGVSGEEKGLLGSAYYADNPTVPIENIAANVNLDMIGRNNPDSVVVIGQTYSSLGPLLQRVNAQQPALRMTVSDDLWPDQRFFFRSDHFNFARREVPAIFFFTGTHEDYHRPSDTVDKIDLDKITRITRLIFHYGLAIANDDQRPQWDPAGLEEVRRLVNQRR
jgi:hypothetical protein